MPTRAYILALTVLFCAPAWGQTRDLERRAFLASVEWEHAPLVLEAADEWSVSAWILLALLWAESRLDCTAVNKRSRAAGCGQWTRTGIRGLNRIRRAAGDARVFTRALAFDPREGIGATAEYLSWLTARWGERSGVAWYNGGLRRRAFARTVFRRVGYYRSMAGLPPTREENMARKKKRQQQPGLTRQGVPDLSHLAGPPPTPRAKLVLDVTCHKCGQDSEFCNCWTAGAARPAGG